MGVGITTVFGDLFQLTLKTLQMSGIVICIYQSLLSVCTILYLLPYKGLSAITKGQDLNTTVNEVLPCAMSSQFTREMLRLQRSGNTGIPSSSGGKSLRTQG